MSKRNWLALMVLVLGIISLIGCSSEEDSDAESDTSKEAEEEENTAELSTDEELTKQLEAEAGVEKAMVQLVDQDGEQMVNIDINIAADQEFSDELKTTYSEMIKKAYPDQSVDVIFAKDGEMLDQITVG